MDGVEIIRAGAITEIVGELSSGRTSLLLGALADVTRGGGAAALVDADGAFDPASAAAAGVDLRRVLWVRCEGRRAVALRAVDLLVRCPGFALVALDVGETPPRLSLADAFRLRLAVRRAGLAFVILGRHRIAGASAAVCVRTVRDRIAWSGPAATPTRLAALRTRVQVLRNQAVQDRAPIADLWWCA